MSLERHCLTCNVRESLHDSPGLPDHAAQYPNPYCKPWNAGLASTTPAVGRRLGRLLDALADEINPNITHAGPGTLSDQLSDLRWEIIQKLKAEGWEITIPKNNYKVKRAK